MTDNDRSIEPYQEPPAVMALRGALAQQRNRFENLLPSIMAPEELFSVAIAAVQKTPRLLECSQESLVKGLLDAARLGLRPDGLLSEGWLVPRYNKRTKRMEASFQTGYRGLEMLMRRAGARKVETRIVYAGEPFKVTYGFAPNIDHEPRFDIDRKDESITHFYAWAKQGNGEIVFEIMTKAEVDRIRDVHGPRDSDGKLSGPWLTDYPEMGRKTVLRRLAKHAELSTEAKEVLAAEEGEIIDVTVEPMPKRPPAERKRGTKRLREKLAEKAMIDPDHMQESVIKTFGDADAPSAELERKRSKEKGDAEEAPQAQGNEPERAAATEADGSRQEARAADQPAAQDEAVEGEYIETPTGKTVTPDGEVVAEAAGEPSAAPGASGEPVEASAKVAEPTEEEMLASILEVTGGELVEESETADEAPAPEPEGEISDGLYIGRVAFPAACEKYDGKLKTYPDGKKRTYFGLKWAAGELLVVAVGPVAEALFKSRSFILREGERVKITGKKHAPATGAFAGRTLLAAEAIETTAPAVTA